MTANNTIMDNAVQAAQAAAEKAADKVAKAAVAELQREYFNTPETAAYLGLSTQFLEIARHKGEGPPYIKLSRAVRYKKTDLDRWMAEHREAG